MQPSRRSLLARMLCLAFLTIPSAKAIAQDAGNYPAKPIRLVVPFAPGGATDIIGRAIAHELSNVLKQSVVVENQGGAGGIIGATNVARAPADGYTLLLSSLSTLGLSSEKIAYDPLRDLAPVSMVAYVSNVLVAHPDFPINSVQELIDLARKQPGQVLYGTGGAGTSVDLASELFSKIADVQLQRVAYRGSGPALLDLIAGRINVMFDNMPSAMPHVTENKLKAIAVTAGKRSSAFPDLPTIKESGLPSYELIAWFGISAPGGTPASIIARLNEALRKAGESVEFRERMAAQSAEVSTSTPQEFGQFFNNEYTKFKQLMSTNPQPQ